MRRCVGTRKREEGVIRKGVVSLEESPESLKSLNSLESLENGQILLCFPVSGGSLKSLDSRRSKFSRISRKWSDSSLFSSVRGVLQNL